MVHSSGLITPVLLSGGSGTRLWPLSRDAYPKQFHALAGKRTLLAAAALRASDPARFAPLIVVANAEHRFLVAEQLRLVGLSPARLVLEPEGRNTAPAAAVAALLESRRDPDAVLLIMPADHVIANEAGFIEAINSGMDAARKGSLVLFGVVPDVPATGYGYIEIGPRLCGEVHAVRQFIEKPDRARAEAYLTAGTFLWNSGIVLAQARTLIAELDTHAPEVLAAARAAVDDARQDLDFIRLGEAAFLAAPSISLDHAVMERTGKAAVVPARMAWTDVGSWSALWEIAAKDGAGNALTGDVVAEGTSGCYLRSEGGPLIAALGVEDLVVITTPDAVLVAHKSRDQDIRALVEHLRGEGHEAATQSAEVHRPWGFYRVVHQGDRFRVKRITVNPGAKLSLQKHFHRAEHWVVVNGTALVTRGSEQFLLVENESTFLPLGCTHRLENPGHLPLNLIEVQSGAYLGEDDIVRFEDDYARD
jgi:mannose-1-phosphate guanylyltransferase/mannose-6-phosphate isomerase